MNNQQFQKLVHQSPFTGTPINQAREGGTARSNGPALGSRARASIPMTPRAVGSSHHNDFARQMAERNASGKERKFKGSAAPKGTKLPSGYRDRAQDRLEDDASAEDGGTLEERVRSLEEMKKLGQIDESTFTQLRNELTGGSLEHTHVVKGLDFKLLERVKRGEDVYKSPKPSKETSKSSEDESKPQNVDEDFEELEKQEVKPLVREKREKRGSSGQLAGKKRSRDEILAELRSSRPQSQIEAEATVQATLGPKFHKVGAEKKKESWIEHDDKGREVLITRDEKGRVKRRVRKPGHPAAASSRAGLAMPDKDAKPLGMDVDVPKAAGKGKDDDDPGDSDIFEGAGEDYDPLADLAEDSSSGESEDGELSAGDHRKRSPVLRDNKSTLSESRHDTTSAESKPTGPRNYFGPEASSIDDEKAPANIFSDPTIRAALKNASSKNLKLESESMSREQKEAQQRRARLLKAQDRDNEDLDMGFGGSRWDNEDEDGEDGKKFKLSTWRGDGNDDAPDDHGGKGGQKRKRGPKKKKANKDSASDVMKVLEGRQGE